MEFVTSLSNNAWGLGFSETGQVFASTANNDHSVLPRHPQPLLRVACAAGAAGAARASPRASAYYPITEHHRQMDWHGKFTAAAGHALYTARAFPQRYWNRVAFVTEGTGHLIHQDVLEPRRQRLRARNATTSWPARRVDVAGDGGGRAGRGRVGQRLVQLHLPAQPDAARVRDRQGQRVRHAAARQEARAGVPDRPRRRRARPRSRSGWTRRRRSNSSRRSATTTCSGG